jgi:hypothetical protein
MSTTREFQDMLNEYVPNELLKEEFVKRDYVVTKCEKDDGWLTGNLVVPFRGAQASSVKFGGLTAADDVASSKYIRGNVAAAKEVWGTLKFNHRDLMEHGKISEQNLLKVLPDEIDDFMDYMKSVVSTNFLNGAHVVNILDGGSADDPTNGLIKVDRPDKLTIGQKLYFDDDDSALSAAGYVKTIDINTQLVLIVTARGGATPLNLSGYTADQNARGYNDGASTDAFASMRDALLSAANGGSTNLYGVAKTAYTYLQAINIDGAAITSANMLSEIFKAVTKTRIFGKGAANEVLMSLTNLGYCMAIIEAQKGSFNVIPESKKASQYGWMEITVGSVTGMPLKLVGIQEADDDVIMLVDWRGIKFYSNGFFQKRKGPNGNEYFEVRETTGYSYIVDVCLFGELVVQRPSYCGIIYNIDVAAAEGNA